MKDQNLRALVRLALEESSLGLSGAFGFSSDDMAAWREAIVDLLDNPSINDNLPRLGADTRRKLSAADRLCGPARLCLRAGGRPEAIARAIRAGFDFTHDDPGTAWVQALVKDEGLERAVRMVCALEETDDLYRMIMNSQND